MHEQLNIAQRALKAAGMANLAKAETAAQHSDGVTLEQAAKHWNVTRGSAAKARQVLTKGAPHIVSGVENGTLSIEAAYRTLSHVAPRRHKKAPVRDTVRSETHRAKASIWQHLRAALDELSSLPAPADVVAIAKAMDRSNLVDRKLTPAILWLLEFEKCLSSKS